jgi:hypothetical protein
MFVIYHISTENGVITTLAAHDAGMDDTETVTFSTNAQGDDVWFPASWIKTSEELKKCVTEFFKVKDRPPECFEWKFIGKTDEGH